MSARGREVGGCAALVVLSVLATLTVLELGIRARYGKSALLDWSNFVVADRSTYDSGASSVIWDPVLGFVPKPGFISAKANHDAEGFRVVPNDPSVVQAPILTIGDSFAYGDEVGDGETWPAYLQGLARQRAINAGVPAYGLDQIVLRAERLASSVQPAMIVMSFIADDVRRMEMSRLWGHEKAYLELAGIALELRHVPVPDHPAPGSKVPLWHRVLGWSYLLRMIENRVVADPFVWVGDNERALPRGMGEKLVCPLMHRLAAIGTPTLVVAQYDPTVWQERRFREEERRLSLFVLQCAVQAGLAALDTFQEIDRAVQTDGLAALYGGKLHHTAYGNRVVAEAIWSELLQRRMMP